MSPNTQVCMMKIIFPQKNQIEFQIWSNCVGLWWRWYQTNDKESIWQQISKGIGICIAAIEYFNAISIISGCSRAPPLHTQLTEKKIREIDWQNMAKNLTRIFISSTYKILSYIIFIFTDNVIIWFRFYSDKCVDNTKLGRPAKIQIK